MIAQGSGSKRDLSSPDLEKRDYSSKCTAEAYSRCKAGEYQSACSCLGAMPSTKTATGPAVTVTKTVTSTSTSEKTTTITNKSQDTPIVDTTIISTILDPSTRTTTITTTVAPARPTVNPGCQGVLLLSRRNHQRGKTDPLYLTLVSGRADEFNIVNSSLQPQSATLRSATGQQGMYTPIFLETAEQQEAYGNQALTCSFAGNRQQPDLSCQLGALNTFYRCPSVSPNALVLSTLCNVAADAALAADCTSAPLHGDCNR